MPGIGLGTFGSDHVSSEEIASAVKYAASVGTAISIALRYTVTKPRSARRSARR